MENWRELTGRDLDRYIAEKLGYTVVSKRIGFIDGLYQWKTEGEQAQSVMPYSTNTDAALTLPVENGVSWHLWKDIDKAHATLATSAELRGIREYAPTLPLAICRAWLAYRESVE